MTAHLRKNRRWSLTVPLLAATVFLLLSGLSGSRARGGEVEPLRAALLTKELGDPRAPGNAKLVLGLPAAYSAPDVRIAPDDFRVYVYPAELSVDEGMTERYRAAGLYLWRAGAKVFLDARVLPQQEDEGPARVRVVFAPGGTVVAEGEAEGSSRYTSDLVDVVLAVDVSLSMRYNDPLKRRVAAARTFIEMARRGGGIGRVGLVTFNQRAAKGTPLLSLDQGEKLLDILNRVGAEGTTNLDEPLDMALDELQGSANPVIILLSDGRNEGHDYEESHLDAAAKGVRIFSVGLSEQADHELLMDMADATGGIYFRAVTDADLPEIYARLAAELGKRQLLQARRLNAAEGVLTYPIDATVKRLVGMVDGGARLAVTGPGADVSAADREMSSVYMGSPAPGPWEFAWDNADPSASLLALFGDTSFFLDVFPPQLRGDKLSVGATLAQGIRPLAGGQVWVEPLPGVLPERMRLFDDGRHGDGDAGDGVYGAFVELDAAPNEFDLAVRASGQAWDKGDFVRQAAAMVIRSTEPPLGRASLGGDIDFGVLFPGETGSAVAQVELDAPSPRELFMDLTWDGAGDAWPDLSSSVRTEPGRREFELEITVPPDAPPGNYLGSFRVGDGGELTDTARARVTVGTVRFGEPGEIDLGVVPPGTFTSSVLRIPVSADKAAPLSVRAVGSDDLSVASFPETVEAGQNEFNLEIIVSAPMGQKDGEYAGRVIIEAGPGRVEIPVVWRVRPYTAKAGDVAPIPGLPKPPALSDDTRPLQQTPTFSPDFWEPKQPRAAADPVASPWERADRVLRESPRLSTAPASPSSYRFPEQRPTKSGSSFWSAWWLYILAALLLLLLLLLLLAYLLYRLGKSALARFLLVSALANIILLIIFILLLSTADSVTPRTVPSVAVNLVENAEPTRTIELTDTEKELLAGIGSEGASASGGASAAPGEISFADSSAASSPGGELLVEKESRLPEGMDKGLQLADATNESRASAVSMATERAENALRRRERKQERVRDEMPSLELREMDEPPPETSERAAATGEVSEARLEIEADAASERPVWSDGERPLQPVASDAGVLLAETTGMEKVHLDSAERRADPRGRRRSVKETSDVYPEPRVEIDDPLREQTEAASPRGRDDAGDPGVEEMRVEAPVAGVDLLGEKRGFQVNPGASRLSDTQPDRLPRGVSGSDAADNAAPRGSRRSARGGAERAEQTGPELRRSVPGGGEADEKAMADAPGMSGASGGGERGGTVGERRFDESGAAAGGGEGERARGTSGTQLADAGRGGGGASPNPFGGGSGGERADFRSGNGTGDGKGMSKNGGRRGERGDAPQPGGGLPGSLSGSGRESGDGPAGGESSGRGKGMNGLGEGRFDDMAAAGDGSGGGKRPNGGSGGGDHAKLSGVGDDSGPDIVSLPGSDSGWMPNERRGRRRQLSVASSSVNMDSLLIVVGDFARLPDAASENLFGALAEIIPGNLTVEERRLAPGDANLSDTLLAVVSPEEMREWSSAAVEDVAGYLKRGGHIWVDAERPEQVAPFMEKLERAADGAYRPLPAEHQLSERDKVDALYIDDNLAAVVTYQDWRKNWRFGKRNGGTLDFLRRSLNYFLSGNADQGIVLDTAPATGERYVEPSRDSMPDSLAGGGGGDGRVWDEFGPETASSWRMPSWSDQGRIAAVSDGQGGRALRMDLGAAVKGRSAAYRTLTPPEDLSEVRYVTLDAYYDGEGDASVSMVFTVEQADAWQDFETSTLPLVKGWNRIRFNLDDRTFRALSTGGADGRALPGRERTGRAGFFVYRDAQSPGVALFRDIRVHE